MPYVQSKSERNAHSLNPKKNPLRRRRRPAVHPTAVKITGVKHWPGQNHGFIPTDGRGLFREPIVKIGGAFGGCTRYARAAKLARKEAVK